MAKFAPVMPLHLMQALWSSNREDVGNYHLWLAHDVIENEAKSQQYGILAGEIRHEYSYDAFIIMDNSICELGDAVGLEPAFQAAAAVKANCVVLPDVMGDGKLTLDKFFEVIDEAHSRLRELPNAPGLMAVPQGPDFNTYLECLEIYSKNNIQYIGIPRIATTHLGSREKLVEAARIICPLSQLHMLGFSDNVFDDVNVARKVLFEHEGIDSAVPVRAGWKDIEFQLSLNDYGKRGRYWEDSVITEMMLNNIATVRGMVAND